MAYAQSTGFDAQTVHATVMNTAEPILDAMMSAPPPGVRKLYAIDGDTSTTLVERNVTGPNPRLKKSSLMGNAQYEVLRAYKLVEQVFRKEVHLRVDSYAIRGGDVGIAKRVAGFLGDNANYLDDVAIDALTDATNGIVMYDGVPVFDAAHPHGYLGATQGNLTTNPLTYPNLRAAHIAMTQLRRENGENYGIDPDTILVGSAMAPTAKEVAGSLAIIRAAALNNLGAEATSGVVTAAGVSNVMAGEYNIVTDRKITSATSWFLLDSKHPDKAIEVGTFDGGVRLVPQDDFTSPAYQKMNEFLYSLYADVYAIGHAWQAISKHGA